MGLSQSYESNKVLWCYVDQKVYSPGPLKYLNCFEWRAHTTQDCRDIIANYTIIDYDPLTMEHIFVYAFSAMVMMKNNQQHCWLRYEQPIPTDGDLKQVCIQSGRRVVWYQKSIDITRSDIRYELDWCEPTETNENYSGEMSLSMIQMNLITQIARFDESIDKYTTIACLAWIFVQTDCDVVSVFIE